jgi:sulfate permease, SulP family
VWLQEHKRSWLTGNVIAALSAAAVLIPQAMAHTSLAGLGPEAGLYANTAAMFAYTLFGTSRQLAVGVTSALTVIVAGALGTLALSGAEESLAATATIAGVLVFGMLEGIVLASFLLLLKRPSRSQTAVH